MEVIDLGRAERALYKVLGPLNGGDYWDSRAADDWVKLALLGEHVLPGACNTDVYGPARYLKPPQVRDVAARLGALSEDSFRKRYVQIAAKNGPGTLPDLESHLQPHFTNLRRFYLAASSQAQVVVITPT